MKQIIINSPAKINLTLKILRKREDNFHDIETIFQMIDLCDELVFTENGKSKEINIKCDNEKIPTDNKNLSYIAAKKIIDYYGISKGVNIKITKKIPISAGLGGGSSNAASTLLALNSLWKLDAKPNELSAMAASIGSDVPFFLYDTCAIGRDRGVLLEKIKILGDYILLLINPHILVSTKWAYDSYKIDLTKNKRNINISTSTSEIDLFKQGPDFINDIEKVVFEKYPVIKLIKSQLLENGAVFSLMSGSGSTVFGVFKDKSSAVLASRCFDDAGYDVFFSLPAKSLKNIFKLKI